MVAKSKTRKLKIEPKLVKSWLKPAATVEEEEARVRACEVFGLKPEDLYAFRDQGDKWGIVVVWGKKFYLPKDK